MEHDLLHLLDRRRALMLIGGAALATIVGACSSDDPTSSSASSTTTSPPTTAGSTASCEEIPTETAGPFPGDGSNGPNVLDQPGVVRSDITKSFGDLSGTAGGVPLTIELTIQDTSKGCAPMAGAAVYLWQCDREGRYSLYSQGATNQNYLRGVQAADADGRLTFLSVFPGAYAGRWPHIHFEVYPSLAKAATADQIATSQLALPEDVCKVVYATEGYESSIRNLAQTSLARDGVFRDGSERQVATMTGSVGAGYTASLVVPV